MYDVFADGTASDFGFGIVVGFVNTVIAPLPYVEPWQPEPLYGHVDAFNYGSVAGTIAAVAASFYVGFVGSGATAAGTLLTRAAKLYTGAETVAGAVTAAIHVYNEGGKVGLVDALNFAPALGFGVGKLAKAVRPYIGARTVPQGYIRGFRAVSEAEYQDIACTGRFALGRGSLEGKWFAETLEGAVKHGNGLHGAGEFRIVDALLPKSALSFIRLANLDRNGPAIYLHLDDLKDVIVDLL